MNGNKLYQICVTNHDGHETKFNDVLYFLADQDSHTISIYLKIDYQMKITILDINQLKDFKVEEQALCPAPSF